MLTAFAIHPSLAASDIKRARAWYEDKLGLVPTGEYDELLEYEVGMMHPKIPPRHPFADRPSIDCHADVMIAAARHSPRTSSERPIDGALALWHFAG